MLFVLVCSEECLFLVCLYRLRLPCALSCFAFFVAAVFVRVWLDLIGLRARISFCCERGQPGWTLPASHLPMAMRHLIMLHFACCLLFALLGCTMLHMKWLAAFLHHTTTQSNRSLLVLYYRTIGLVTDRRLARAFGSASSGWLYWICTYVCKPMSGTKNPHLCYYGAHDGFLIK